MDDVGLGSPHSGRFATTRWTMVQAVGVDAPESKDALAELCSTYWYPLYAYLRRKGHQAVDAQDLTQAFVASLLERSAVKRADPEKGRFRSFLLGSLTSLFRTKSDDKVPRNVAGIARSFPSMSTPLKIAIVWSRSTK